MATVPLVSVIFVGTFISVKLPIIVILGQCCFTELVQKKFKRGSM